MLEGVGARHPQARPGMAPALRQLDLRLSAGEQVAVIGPSGAGKTTLMQLLACALPPSAGRLTLDGRSPWELPRRELQALRGRLFLAPQLPPLPPRQRVVTAVLAGRLPALGLLASVRALLYPDDIPAAFAALERFDLGDKLFERVDRLSGGERQRVGLARALLAPASVWLLDEPLSSLDPARSRQALATLRQQARERGATLVATLHQVDAALSHFPRIIGLRDGALAFDLPAERVTPAHLERLYEQHEQELLGQPAFDSEPVTDAPAPVIMQCR
ncbi:MAG: Phosphate-import ATP-binding protein PhnC [Pseudomonadota bacterium]